MSSWSPNENYRYSLKVGMTGADVWALQVALNSFGAKLAEDGAFGPKTQAAVLEAQRELAVTADGVAGPQTQAGLCAAECVRAEDGVTPKGLLKGMCFGESGGIIPTTSPPYGDGSRDYGPFQEHLLMPGQGQLREAFYLRNAAALIALRLSNAHRRYTGQAGARTPEEAWRLAVLSYNWPAAAEKIAAGEGDTWVYIETGTGTKRHLRDPAPWVQAYRIPGVNTGYDWIGFYVESKVVYVKAWTV